jgi:NAD dependent epimerase/dehydratase family.
MGKRADRCDCVMDASVFIFGAGYSGRAIARALPDVRQIAGTTRSPAKTGMLAGIDIEPHLYAGDGFGTETAAALRDVTHLIVSIAPGKGGDPALADLSPDGRDKLPSLRWIGYLSTVGVYGDHGGAWVDEMSECRPVSERSRQRLEAEKAWAEFGRTVGVPVAILRLSGIYGPGRNALVNLAKGTAKRIVKQGQVFNRIHVEDIAGATRHLMREMTGGVFNISDDEPSPPQDVVTYAAELMGVEPPPEIPFEEAEMSPMARSFYGERKRISNAKLKAAGYCLRFADYRSGLKAMWDSGEWENER